MRWCSWNREDLGDADAAVLCEVLGEALGVAPLGREVQLAAGGLSDLLAHAAEVDALAHAPPEFEQPQGEPGRREIRLHQHVDAGAKTFTTTGSPPENRAAWTWAREAAPTAAAEIQEKTSSTGRPKSASIWATIAGASGGTSSCNPASCG